MNSIVFSHNDFSLSGSEKNYMNFGNFVNMMRPSCFQISFGPLSLLPKSFVTMIFLQLVVQEKEDTKQNREMKILDKVAENLTRGRRISIDSVRSENYFESYGYKIEDMGHIESDKSNLAYSIDLCYLKPG